MSSNVRTFWKIYPPFLLIVVLTSLAVGLYASDSISSFENEKTIDSLHTRAVIIRHYLTEILDFEHRLEVDKLCKTLGKESNSRITVILANGTVIGDTLEDPTRMEKHDTRDEVLQANTRDYGVSERVSETLGERHLYVAVSIRNSEGKIIGYIRNSKSIEDLSNELAMLYMKIILGVLFSALIAAIVSVFVAKRITTPLLALERGATKFANNQLDFRISEDSTREIAALSCSLNQMASNLSDRIKIIEEQRNETECILSSLHEGVLAFDSKQTLVWLNKPVCQLFGIDASFGKGKKIREITRNTDLHGIVDEVFANGKDIHREIAFRDPKYSHVLARGSILKDTSEKSIGVLIVLNNVTSLRKLETLRKDFVANVSHELKTPITSIKGFCENLLDGALQEPEIARKFVTIVSSETNRINAIIDDLLSLSQLERISSTQEIEFRDEKLSMIVKEAVEITSSRASQNNISLEVIIEEEIEACVNENLLVEAITNLIDNAIKYSSSGKKVKIKLSRVNEECRITVSDNGLGISQDHISRIFERFYRVDKARTRKLGGTGLGLAIVKHISLVHGGRVSVDSSLGIGSEFSIILPDRNQCEDNNKEIMN